MIPNKKSPVRNHKIFEKLRKIMKTNTLLVTLKLIVMAVFTIAFFAQIGAETSVKGQSSTTFAQFFERNGTQDFVFTNNTTSADFATTGGGSPIFFLYQNVPGLDASLQGPQQAHLIMTSSTTTVANINGSNLTQPFSSMTNTIQILRDTPAPVGNGTRTNLLTITFAQNSSLPSKTGSGGSSTINVTTPDNVVTFSSDFLIFSGTTQRNFGMSFSSVTPALSIGAGGFLSSFTAAGSGTFASNPVPTLPPTAAGVELGGRVVNESGVGMRRVRLQLVNSLSGEVMETTTNSDGTYLFTDVMAGHTYVLTASYKDLLFAPSSRVIQVVDTVQDVDFTVQSSRTRQK
jgi:hypothetical protein